MIGPGRMAVLVLGALAATLFGAETRLALADAPPPPTDFLGSCTVAAQAQKGESCELCGAHFSAPDRCQAQLGSKGYTRRCRDVGVQAWNEVWCAAKAAEAPASGSGTAAQTAASASASAAPSSSATPPAGAHPESSSGCAAAPGRARPRGALLALFGAVALGARARRRRAGCGNAVP